MRYTIWLVGFYCGIIFTKLFNLIPDFSEKKLIDFTFFNLLILGLLFMMYLFLNLEEEIENES